ncbi:DsbA family protein [Bailinhaonella thermotolerans]|uniref:DsbA family protein n=1 Tax=Bailinhaonella thermotolerans TaxID=1070861 RepID=UPI00192A56BF|nr:thioredoxin domain-containing protein [Bailinhaonella thermotolerans]
MESSEERTAARRSKVDALRAESRRQEVRRRNLAITATVVAAFVLVVGAVFVIGKVGPGGGEAVAAGESRLVRADSHRLQTAADGKVTVVEFLDFECEACGAYFPMVEQLRARYAGKVTFVTRYFPIASHFNAERAARAVEAAARQGRFEAMYRRMFESQKEWGEKRIPADEIFRGYAKALGLDMAAWEKAYADPATLDRIRKDAADGEALGVQGTPTFFLNGKKIQPQSYDEFKAAIDAALAG